MQRHNHTPEPNPTYPDLLACCFHAQLHNFVLLVVVQQPVALDGGAHVHDAVVVLAVAQQALQHHRVRNVRELRRHNRWGV